MDDLHSAANAVLTDQSTVLAQEDELSSSSETVEMNGRFGPTFQPKEPLIKFTELQRPSLQRSSPFRASTSGQSNELSMASTASASSKTSPSMVIDATPNDSDISFHTPPSVSDNDNLMDFLKSKLRTASVQRARTTPISLIRGDYTPMQAKVQPFRPTHLYKATYGILEPMIFEVFLDSAKTFAAARDIHGILRECATKCLLPYDPMLAGQPYSLQDDKHLTLADQLQGTTPRTATSVAEVSRQVPYQPPHHSFTPSNTAVRSPPAAFAMSTSARSMLPQRQVSFSPEVHDVNNPSSTNDVSLTEALQSLASVNQAVVQTLRELKPAKSSSSHSRFPVDKILPYAGKCQLGDCYTSRPAAWCNHFRDKACAFQLDEKLWTVYALLASAPVVSHRWRDLKERPKCGYWF